MFHVAAVSFSACNNAVPNIVIDSSAQVRISVDSSDMAIDEILQLSVFFLCKFNFLNVSK